MVSSLTIRTTAVEAFRAALTVKDPGATHAILHVPFNNGKATELFATDNRAIVFVPIEITQSTWTNNAPTAIAIRIANTKIPARVHAISLSSLTTETNVTGTVLADDRPCGFATLEYESTPAARRVAPAGLPPLPAAPPYGYDTLHAASILRASSKTPPDRHEPIQLPQAGYAFRWAFNTGGELILVANRASDEERNAFKNALEFIRERTA
jgi:hypothetical protein